MTSDELLRMRELRDNLEWFIEHPAPNKYWKHYKLGMKSTLSIVESIIAREVRNGSKEAV